ncbi:MAG: tetratricopeptide repeat protein [Rhodobacteraceae bacterium]|jgi:tetratricopeptide (TPR) repeat protein|nr:tetratricopeptide repeat protein [Paracoccaceae bacterium]
MMKMTFLALATAGLLSFCDTAEERADGYYKSGLELLQQGDVDRALVEFRNVFKLNGAHREARLHYAQAEQARGNTRAAMGQYLRLVEQYPDSLPGQRALAELSLEVGDWEAARRHGAAAAELAPDDTLVQAVNTMVAYRDALVGRGDPAAMRAAVIKAQVLVSQDPDMMIARRIIIDDLVRNKDWGAALSAIDAALAEAPDARELYTIRLGVLSQLGETGEIRAQLEDMITRFPDDANVPTTLVRWYVSQGRIDEAQAFLKERAVNTPGAVDDIVTYIRFLAEARSRETALAELEEILNGTPPAVERLTALRAGFRFDLGDRDAAIAEMEKLIDGMTPSDERRSIMVMLAKMLNVTGNNVGARALIEEVLQEDASQPDALKMRARWLIESDRTDEAIVALRSVLGEAPNDADAMTLMAQAHERAGNRDLMADMLGRAVEASGNAPDESLRYARYLIGQGQPRAAETVLINALRLVSGNVALLGALGEVYVGEQDWPRLTQVIETLRNQGGAGAERIANGLTARQLAAQDREDELMSFLDTLAGEGSGGIGAAAAIVRTRLAQGDTEGARQYARETLEGNPDNVDAQFLMASVQAVTGDVAAATEALRGLASEFPKDQRFWLALYNIHAVQENVAAARQALTDGIAQVPDSLRLNWALAGVLEREGNVAGAIGIYEKLYAANSNNLIIANNLASLLATGRDDAESLERAHEIARRLRDRNVPAFQDTYGWIAFRRGDLDTALTALTSAAEGLPNDPSVQYHLARIHAARGQDAEALAQFRKVVEIVGNGARPDFMTEVEAEIERLVTGTKDGGTQN